MPDRDAKGLFLPGNSKAFKEGNPGGPGNPNVAHVTRLKTAALNAISPKTMHRIIRKMAAVALKHGDKGAADFVFDRTIGKATIRVDAGPQDDMTRKMQLLLVMMASDPAIAARMEEIGILGANAAVVEVVPNADEPVNGSG